MTTAPYRRYGVAAAAFVIQGVVIGSLFAYGVFFKSLEAELGWSRTLLSASTSLSFLVMGTLAILGGRLNDRFGPRWVLSASGLCFGLGYGLMYYVNAPWQLFAFYGVL
ncbi:MAG: MFS transporter, partial [Gammaproteobacteria bacterium]